jgi:hypothetical protein
MKPVLDLMVPALLASPWVLFDGREVDTAPECLHLAQIAEPFESTSDPLRPRIAVDEAKKRRTYPLDIPRKPARVIGQHPQSDVQLALFGG